MNANLLRVNKYHLFYKVMQQPEGGGNLVNQSEAKDAPNVASLVDSQSAAG